MSIANFSGQDNTKPAVSDALIVIISENEHRQIEMTVVSAEK